MRSRPRGISILQTPVLTRQNVADSYEQPAKAELALNALERLGIFEYLGNRINSSFNYGNPKLLTFTLLGLYTYFTGYLGKCNGRNDGEAGTYIGSVTQEEGQRDWRRIFRRELGLKFDPNHRFGENGAYYARALVLAGFGVAETGNGARHTKGNEGMLIPEYIMMPIKHYDRLSGKSKILAKSLARLLTDSFCDTRLRDEKPTFIRFSLISQPTRPKLVTEATQIMAAFNLLYPDLDMSFERNTSYIKEDSRNSLWTGFIDIHADQAREIADMPNAPIRSVPISRPTFKINRINGLS